MSDKLIKSTQNRDDSWNVLVSRIKPSIQSDNVSMKLSPIAKDVNGEKSTNRIKKNGYQNTSSNLNEQLLGIVIDLEKQFSSFKSDFMSQITILRNFIAKSDEEKVVKAISPNQIDVNKNDIVCGPSLPVLITECELNSSMPQNDGKNIKLIEQCSKNIRKRFDSIPVTKRRHTTYDPQDPIVEQTKKQRIAHIAPKKVEEIAESKECHQKISDYSLKPLSPTPSANASCSESGIAIKTEPSIHDQIMKYGEYMKGLLKQNQNRSTADPRNTENDGYAIFIESDENEYDSDCVESTTTSNSFNV